jgi:hypothetical protein
LLEVELDVVDDADDEVLLEVLDVLDLLLLELDFVADDDDTLLDFADELLEPVVHDIAELDMDLLDEDEPDDLEVEFVLADEEDEEDDDTLLDDFEPLEDDLLEIDDDDDDDDEFNVVETYGGTISQLLLELELDIAVRDVETPLIPGPFVELDDVNAPPNDVDPLVVVVVFEDGELGRVPR